MWHYSERGDSSHPSVQELPEEEIESHIRRGDRDRTPGRGAWSSSPDDQCRVPPSKSLYVASAFWILAGNRFSHTSWSQ
jgi:hypothetical protein